MCGSRNAPYQPSQVVAQVNTSVAEKPHFEVSVFTLGLIAALFIAFALYRLAKIYRRQIVAEIQNAAPTNNVLSSPSA